MRTRMSDGIYADIRAKLQIDCSKCSGLCCVALYCFKTDGFPENKEAGTPCRHLLPNFRCDIHSSLSGRNMRGCTTYDCFGAGQKVTQASGPNMNWNSAPDKAGEIFRVFLTLCQLHQMEWYLLDSLPLALEEQLRALIEALIMENEDMTGKSPGEILQLEIEEYRERVNLVLRQITGSVCNNTLMNTKNKNHMGKNFKHASLDGADLGMSLLIAADLEGCSLKNTSFLGADMRDANIKNTDLSSSLFLTQMQVNSAKGNVNTRLPGYLTAPASWHM